MASSLPLARGFSPRASSARPVTYSVRIYLYEFRPSALAKNTSPGKAEHQNVIADSAMIFSDGWRATRVAHQHNRKAAAVTIA